ncbi:MAG: serralysin [Methylobacteriaceae bacterium]|nr:serralysin [Methylobacteriaceae bacterium]
MQINLVYDSQALAAPQSFRDAIQAAANVLDATFTDNITINISVGYGEINGTPESSGGASAGPSRGVFDSYSQVRTWLAQNASPDVQSGVAAMPTGTSIQGQSQVIVWRAQQRLMGQAAASDSVLDGAAGFATNISTNLLEGVALHELTHAMGRVPYSGSQPDMFDLYRFSSTGTYLFGNAQPTAAASYFSLDGGRTDLADYGRTSDPSDFLNSSGRTPNDPFNEFYNASTVQGLSHIDILQMEALGFHTTPTSPGAVSINDVSIAEGDAGTRVATFTVTRTGGTAAFNVSYSTSDGSAAVADQDYVANSGTLSFGVGVNTQTISVTVNGDTRSEPDQTFFVNISAATNGATISDGVGQGTILNDDIMPAATQVHANDLTYSSTASGYNHFIDLLNFEASYPDLIRAFGTNQQAMQTWYNANEPNERRPETFDGLDYVASYGDLINAFRSAGSMHAVQDDGGTHFITVGWGEGRATTFNGLDYIASYSDLIAAFGANNDAGAYHYIENGQSEGRTTTFDGLDYIASYTDLVQAFGVNEQAGAMHYINNGVREGRTTTFDGLSYIANYTDLMHAVGANNDAGASHYIGYGLSEGRSASFDVAGYEAAHPDLQGRFATNDQFLTAYINTYVATGQLLT